MNRAPRVVVVGPAGSGKTTVGRALSVRLGVPFVDADDLHPAANRERMARGEPLDDDARGPWLDAIVAHLQRRDGGFVLACSALRAAYRTRLAAGLHDLVWVQLDVPPAELARRLAVRSHFFPAGLLPSQLAAWEPPAVAVRVDGTAPVDAVVATIVRALAPAE